LSFTATAVLFLVWFHRSYQNLAAFGTRDLQFSASWAVGWWFVPIAGLWKPYFVTAEVWNASNLVAPPPPLVMSRRGGDASIIRLWWTAWLVALLLFNVAAFSVQDNGLMSWQSSLSTLSTVIAAGLTILMVMSIGARQDARWAQLASPALPESNPTLPVEQP
jgi:hypothetical protein